MPLSSFHTLQIGLIGHPDLLRYNILQLQKFPISILPVCHPMQIAQIDGLLITGWHVPSLWRRIYPLQKSILRHLERISLWGISSGAVLLGQNGLFPVLDTAIVSYPQEQISTSILELPCCGEKRFVGYFVPNVVFSSPAPNIGVLCQNQSHGIVAIRQGNHLASGFAAEFTPACSLYPYWLEMVADLKEWLI